MHGDDTDLRAEMTSLITADTFDQGKALTMINDRAAAIQANAAELVAAAAVFFDGLSAEQKAQIQQFAEKRGNRHHKGHGKH
jgi:Spy/CpxP family protein refolding chaperone